VVEVEEEERAKQGVSRLGNLQRHHFAARPHGARHLRERGVDVRHVPQRETNGGAVEVVARHRKRFRLADDQPHAMLEAKTPQLGKALAEHRLAQVDPDGRPGLADGLDREITGARRHVQCSPAGGELALADGEATPAVVHAHA